MGTGLPWAAQKILMGCPSYLPIVRLKSSDVNLGDLALIGSEIDGNFMEKRKNLLREITWQLE